MVVIIVGIVIVKRVVVVAVVKMLAKVAVAMVKDYNSIPFVYAYAYNSCHIISPYHLLKSMWKILIRILKSVVLPKHSILNFNFACFLPMQFTSRTLLNKYLVLFIEMLPLEARLLFSARLKGS